MYDKIKRLGKVVLIMLLLFTSVTNSRAQFTKTNFARNATVYNASGYVISEYYGNGEYQKGYLTASNVDADGEKPLGIIVTATLPNGNTQWSKFIATEDSLRIAAVTYDDRDNSYIFTGYTLNLTTGTVKTACATLLKIDSWGNAKWLRSFYTNGALCAGCGFDLSPAFMVGVDILKVKSDPRPNSSTNDFVVVGFMAETPGAGLLTLPGISRRNFIWRFSTDLADDPQITTRFFKTYHGGYYDITTGAIEPTNYDVPISIKEIDGEGFFVTGTTKDTNYHLAWYNQTLNGYKYAPRYSVGYNPYYGLINYDAGGNINTGLAFFKYAFYDAHMWSRNPVRMLPDISSNLGYVVLNNNDRATFEILSINLTSGVPTIPTYFQPIPTGNFSDMLVANNIFKVNNNAFQVCGYSIDQTSKDHVHPFTCEMNLSTLANFNITVNKIKSNKYINYTPLSNRFDFMKTNTYWPQYLSDSFRSVIAPLAGIKNNFLGRNDIVITSPHYTTYNFSDTVLAQSISAFQNGGYISCKPQVFQAAFYQGFYAMIDYRKIALVDTITPLFKYNLPVSTLNNPLEINCVTKKHLYRFASQDMENEQLSIYPNPTTSGIINISHTNWRKATLTDVTGKEVLRFNEPVTRIDLSGYTSGIYFLTIYLFDNRKQNFKIVLK